MGVRTTADEEKDKALQCLKDAAALLRRAEEHLDMTGFLVWGSDTWSEKHREVLEEGATEVSNLRRKLLYMARELR